jgi:hypothetical protein
VFSYATLQTRVCRQRCSIISEVIIKFDVETKAVRCTPACLRLSSLFGGWWREILMEDASVYGTRWHTTGARPKYSFNWTLERSHLLKFFYTFQFMLKLDINKRNYTWKPIRIFARRSDWSHTDPPGYHGYCSHLGSGSRSNYGEQAKMLSYAYIS